MHKEKKNILQNLSKFYFQGIADDISNTRVISTEGGFCLFRYLTSLINHMYILKK